MTQIKKQDAANAVRSAFELLYEARELVHAVDHLEADSCVDVSVLQNVAAEKQHQAFHAIDFADDYFTQKLKKAKKKKLAVVRKAA